MVDDKCYFFFSSRRRHTRYWRDWSSDVCSSDLAGGRGRPQRQADPQPARHHPPAPGRADRGDQGEDHGGGQRRPEIGRASCRERAKISVVAVSLKKKTPRLQPPPLYTYTRVTIF